MVFRTLVNVVTYAPDVATPSPGPGGSGEGDVRGTVIAVAMIIGAVLIVYAFVVAMGSRHRRGL